jgi:hypothetical protein
MLIVHGTYRFARKCDGYRAGYCNGCEQPRLLHRIRAFVVGHLYGIPLLPMGFWHQWTCASCGKNPALVVRTRRSLVMLLAVLIGLVAALPLTIIAFTDNTPDGRRIGVLGALVGWAVVAALGFVYSRMKPMLSKAEQQARITPTDPARCALCSGELFPTPGGETKCMQCGIARLG